jgi:hypothetical protein
MPGSKRSLAAVVLTLALLAIAAAPAISVFGVTVGEGEGCTPGYWKNHTSAWEEYSPTDKVGPTFGSGLPQSNDSLLQALSYGGGSGTDGARRILLRAATAALLNAAHDSLDYPLRRYQSPPSPDGFVPVVRSLLASGDRSAMLAYAEFLDRTNNADCPLN